MPATRTPEGNPLYCLICGNEHLVLISSPPGDSVCPSCGSHSWLDARDTREKQVDTLGRLDSVGRKKIQLEVRMLVDLLRTSSDKSEMARHLTNGLVHCLAARGSTIWSLGDKKDWNGSRQLERIAWKGVSHDKAFAELVASENYEIMRLEVGDLGDLLRIGVPLRIGNQVVGVVEVAQRSTAPLEARTGFMRFVKSMVSVVEGNPIYQ